MSKFYAHLRSITHAAQRISGQVGDWLNLPDPDGDAVTAVNVSATGDWRYDALIAVHELVEAILCRARGIATAEVDAFDSAHPDTDQEQGDLPDAPYRREHCFATGVERLLCAELGLDWAEYEAAIERVLK